MLVNRKILSSVQECVKVTKEGKTGIWFDSENETFNAEFIWNNNLVKGMSIAIRFYKLILFSGLQISNIFLLNKPH